MASILIIWCSFCRYTPHLKKRDAAQGATGDSDDDEFFDVDDGSDVPVVAVAIAAVTDLLASPAQLSIAAGGPGTTADSQAKLQSLPDVTATVKAEASTMLSNAAAQILQSGALDSETLGLQEAYESSGWSTLEPMAARSSNGPGTSVRRMSSESCSSRARSGSLSLSRTPIRFESLAGQVNDNMDKLGKIAREIEQLKDQLNPVAPKQRKSRGTRTNVAWNVTCVHS